MTCLNVFQSLFKYDEPPQLSCAFRALSAPVGKEFVLCGLEACVPEISNWELHHRGIGRYHSFQELFISIN